MSKYVFSVFDNHGNIVWEEHHESYQKLIYVLVLNDVLDEEENLVDEDYGMVILYEVPDDAFANWFITEGGEMKDKYELARISR